MRSNLPFCFGCELHKTAEGWRKLTVEELIAYPMVKPPILYPDLTEEQFGKWWDCATPKQRYDRLGYDGCPEEIINVSGFAKRWMDLKEDKRRDFTIAARFAAVKTGLRTRPGRRPS